jgi:hypothetical protein
VERNAAAKRNCFMDSDRRLYTGITRGTTVSFVFFLLLLMSSCHRNMPFSKVIQVEDAHFKGYVKVEKIEKLNRYCITIKNSITLLSDKIYTPYEIYAMETGDVNHDGRTDICIGIIKPTPFDPAIRKRLFIFQIDSNYIRPLWLSSRLVHPLEEFKIIRNMAGSEFILTIEKESKSTFCLNEYNWKSFGMSYIREYDSGLSLSEAVSMLKSYNNNKSHIPHEF